MIPNKIEIFDLGESIMFFTQVYYGECYYWECVMFSKKFIIMIKSALGTSLLGTYNVSLLYGLCDILLLSINEESIYNHPGDKI